MATGKVVIFEGGPTCCGSFHEWCGKVKYVITNSYIEKQSGLCCESIDNLELIRVKDVAYQSSCCCNECGTITIISSDTTTPTLMIKGIPNGKDVFEKLRNAVSSIDTKANIEIQS